MGLYVLGRLILSPTVQAMGAVLFISSVASVIVFSVLEVTRGLKLPRDRILIEGYPCVGALPPSRLLRVLRMFFRIAPPSVSREQAVRVAVDAAAERGVQPRLIRVSEDLQDWRVTLNYGWRHSIEAIIDAGTGECRQFNFCRQASRGIAGTAHC